MNNIKIVSDGTRIGTKVNAIRLGGIMRKIDDYHWQQVSMWENTPRNCIEKYVTTKTGLSGKVVCHFYLCRIKEIISDNHWKTEAVESMDGVPKDILNWRNDNYRLKVGGRAA